MAAFERKYAGERLRAILAARFDKGLSFPEISKRAKAGELVPDDPFEISTGYLGKLCAREAKARELRFTSPLADKPHRDAIEELRRGLVAAADDMLTDYRNVAKKTPAKADPGRGREIARLIREAAAIPAQKEDTPPKPLARVKTAEDETNRREPARQAHYSQRCAHTTPRAPNPAPQTNPTRLRSKTTIRVAGPVRSRVLLEGATTASPASRHAVASVVA
jgi:hypothetical protein